jgi:hypothetical protein
MASIADATPDTIRLDCTSEEFRAQKPFVEKNLAAREITHILPDLSSVWDHPCTVSEKVYVPIEIRHIPLGELAVQNGARARTRNKDVGRVVDFLMDPETEKISSIVVRSGHLWMQKDVAIPASQIDHLGEKVVSIKQS